MDTFTFIVDPSGKEIEVQAWTKKEAARLAWNQLTEDERDSTASLEMVERRYSRAAGVR